VSAPQDTRVTVRRRLHASLAEVFACFTDERALARWLYAGDVERCEVESDFRVGGRYCIRMHGRDGGLDEKAGEWIEIVPQRRLRMSWTHDDGHKSLVSFRFEAAESGTWLEVTHEELPPEMCELYNGGWNQCLDQLGGIL